MPDAGIPHGICPHIILASASPRRLELLRQIGIRSRVQPVDIDESARVDESPAELVRRLAIEKARCCMGDIIQQQSSLADGTRLPVLGSDTVVEIKGEVLGKPADSGQAVVMLTKLSGRTHNVHTAVALLAGDDEYTDISTSQVEFMELNEEIIRSYVDTGEPFGKAGAYAIQGMAGQFVKSLKGSYSGVMGLPIYETARLLALCGISTIQNKE